MYEDSAAEVVEEILQGEGEMEFEAEGYFGQGGNGEAELASELLELSSDHELDHFFGKLFKTVSRAVKSPAGKMLTGTLRGIAKKALPIAGSVAGNLIAPGIGGMLGGNVAGALGSALGLEAEGLSQEEEQFEVAKRVVRTAQQAVRQVTQDPQSGADPRSAVKNAVTSAVRAHLPGLGGGSTQASAGQHQGGSAGGGGRSGRWVRRGSRIVVLGI